MIDAGSSNDIRFIESWLRLDIAVKWCEKHSISYKLDISKGYQKDYPEDALRDSVEKIRYLTKKKGKGSIDKLEIRSKIYLFEERINFFEVV